MPLPDGCDQAVWGQSLIEEVNADLKRVGLPPLVLTHPIQYRGKPPGTYSTVLVSDETFEAVLEQARARRWSRVGRDIERLFSNPAPSALEVIPRRDSDGTLTVAFLTRTGDLSQFYRVPREAEPEFWRLWQEYANRLVVTQTSF